MTAVRLAVTGRAMRGSGAGVPLPSLPTDRREEPSVAALVPLARGCLAQAGREPGPEVGLVLALGSAIAPINQEHARAVRSGKPGAVSPRAFIYTTPNALTARIAILLGLAGECLTLPNPAAPFWAAADLLVQGRAVTVLAGGSCLAPGQPAPDGGAAMLCLELPAVAAKRGARVLGWVTLAEAEPGAVDEENDEAWAAACAVALLEPGPGGAVRCGRRGRVVVEPAPDELGEERGSPAAGASRDTPRTEQPDLPVEPERNEP